ncbi:MAG TPA: 16S rRNA (cytosine(1402)-N(4))-methyltransferase RsmH [Cytophagaceae bacterium]|nr:16S rRNA (cytosine(1402)-N(4))-methyltransferase RsmH [Cytophagaceae bacterium]
MYHIPVMLKECIEGLAIKPDGIYVDVTFGGGGHSKEILKHLTSGKLFSFDQDEDAKANAAQINESSFTLIEANFRYLKRYLKLNGITQIDGLLADLGISSHQIDSAERGFSTRFNAELDMRMDRSAEKSAKDIIATYSEKDLHKIFGMYGEVTNAKTLAATIVKLRANNKINTVEQLKEGIRQLAPRGKENKYYAQVFQALRIEVNDELKALEEMLTQSAELLKPGGRMVVMSYHSLEDRLVKNFIAKGLFHGEPEKDVYGNFSKPFEALTRKPVEASEAEVEQNNRARSAKLRIGIKL